MRSAALRADALLLFVAAMWGSGFIAQKVAMESMGPMGFNAARYLVGAVVVAPFALRGRFTRAELWSGVVLGVAMAIAAGFQQAGMVTTTASRAGFITGLYVPLVPLIGLMLGQRLVVGHVVGGVLAVVGMGLLAGDLSGGIARGDFLVMVCALMWAVHVVMIGRCASWADPLRLAFVQFVTVVVLSGAWAAVFEADKIAGVTDAMGPVLYSGVLVIGVAFTLQIVAQKTAPASHAAVLMSLEAVFAAIFGWLLLKEMLGPRELAGAGLMLAGMLTSQLWPHKRTEAERAELIDAVR